MPQFNRKPNRFVTEYPDQETNEFVSALNKINESLPASIVGAAPIFVEQFMDRYIISYKNDAIIKGNELQEFVVLEEFDDYLKCTPFEHKLDTTIYHDKDLGSDEDNETAIQADANATLRKLWADKIAAKEERDRLQAAKDQNNSDQELSPEDLAELNEDNDANLEVVNQLDFKDDDLDVEDPETIPHLRVIYYVAKPRLLQREPFDGKIVRQRRINILYNYSDNEYGGRTAHNEDDSQVPDEYQVITPPYMAGDIITAHGEQYTGYVIDDDEEFQNSDDSPALVLWADMNTGGRQWAVDPGGEPGTDVHGDDE